MSDNNNVLKIFIRFTKSVHIFNSKSKKSCAGTSRSFGISKFNFLICKQTTRKVFFSSEYSSFRIKFISSKTLHLKLSFFRWKAVLLKVYIELYCLLIFLKYLLFNKIFLVWPCSSKSSCNLVCPPTQLRLSERVSFLQVQWNGKEWIQDKDQISEYLNILMSKANNSWLRGCGFESWHCLPNGM